MSTSIDQAGGGSGQITDSIVEYSSDSGQTWTSISLGVWDGGWVVISGLETRATYWFRVSHANTDGVFGGLSDVRIALNYWDLIESGDFSVFGEGTGAPGTTGLNLTGLDLEGSFLNLADFSGANLANANLRATSLRFADFGYQHWSGLTPQGADLSGANLENADLTGADLRGANLTGASLDGAQLGAVLCDSSTVWPPGYYPPTGCL